MKDTISQNTNRKNLLQLLWLSLIAIFGQVATIFFLLLSAYCIAFNRNVFGIDPFGNR